MANLCRDSLQKGLCRKLVFGSVLEQSCTQRSKASIIVNSSIRSVFSFACVVETNWLNCVVPESTCFWKACNWAVVSCWSSAISRRNRLSFCRVVAATSLRYWRSVFNRTCWLWNLRFSSWIAASIRWFSSSVAEYWVCRRSYFCLNSYVWVLLVVV